MKKSKWIIFTLVISLLFLFGAVAGQRAGNAIDKLTKGNTTELMATVIKAETKGTEPNEYGIIYTEEYGEKLKVFNIEKLTDVNDFNSLQTGQTVLFRIENVWLGQFEEMSFINIVSLRTMEREMISLSSYNENADQGYSRMRTTGELLAPMFFLVSVHCVLLLMGVNVFRKFR